MNISKLGALWSLMKGGWAGLATYILEAVNAWLAKLDKTKFAEVAKIVNAISNALSILLAAFIPEKYKSAAQKTIDALNGLANALADGELSQTELDAQIDLVEDAIAAWKAVA